MSLPVPPDHLPFTGDPEADRLIATDPLALLIGFALDQQVTVQKAFSGPLELRRRIGSLDASTIATMDEERLDAAFRTPPALHRFPGNMARRTQEVGIRIALGASATSVTRMVIGEGARLVAIAVAIGLVAAAGAARLLRSQLFGVQPNDLLTFAVVTVVLSAVAILACYVPARRASRVDPMVALRSE